MSTDPASTTIATTTTATTTTAPQSSSSTTTTTTTSTTKFIPAPSLDGKSITIIPGTCDDVTNSNATVFDNYHLRLCDCKLEDTSGSLTTEKLPVAYRMIPTNNYAVSWAWASLMLHLVITGFFALMWIHHVTPAITPPYNKAVLAIFLCLLGLIIIDCCGMSKYIVRDDPHPTASASLCFNMFLFFLGAYLAMGAYQERDPNAFASQQFN